MMNRMHTRRDMLRVTTAGLGGALVSARNAPAADRNGIPTRILGRTGEEVTILTVGGWHIGSIKDDSESIRLMRATIDEGVNFFDNAWCYHDGRSEELMGRALRDGYRQRVFLMTKVHGRDKKGAMAHLEDSLGRFGTDTIDLWQFHDLREGEDKQIFAPGGAIEAAIQAREQGKVRYIGFTGHNSYRWHLDMLGHDFEWDAVQMPVNLVDPHMKSFMTNVLPILRERNIGVIAMKPMDAGRLARTDLVTAEQALHWAMSQPVATVVSGMDSMEVMRKNIASARAFEPMNEKEQNTLVERVKGIALDGKHQTYKA